MIPGTAPNRAEVRRLVSWFDEGLYGEVVAPLMEERMTKRLVSRDAPDTRVLREAMKTANNHIDYIDYLLDHRRWLAGPVLSLADLTAAAHLSVADYLGGIDWRGHKQTADWYCGDEVEAELPAAARRADGGDRAAAPLRQGRFLICLPMRSMGRGTSEAGGGVEGGAIAVLAPNLSFLAKHPSTTLRVVPLPISRWGGRSASP